MTQKAQYWVSIWVDWIMIPILCSLSLPQPQNEQRESPPSPAPRLWARPCDFLWPTVCEQVRHVGARNVLVFILLSSITIRPLWDPMALQPKLERLPKNCMNTERRGEKPHKDPFRQHHFNTESQLFLKPESPLDFSTRQTHNLFYWLKPVGFGLLSFTTESWVIHLPCRILTLT